MSLHTQIQDVHIDATVEFFKKNNHGYSDLSMRYGKTRYAIEVLKKIYDYDPCVLIAYPYNIIKNSWVEECKKWEYDNPNITYVNFRSLFKYENKIFDIVIIDEMHKASDNQRDIAKKIIKNDDEVKCLAFSGTISKETQLLWGLPKIVSYSTLEGIEQGILADYQVTVHFVDLDTKVKTPNKKGKLLSEKQRYDNYTYVINKFKEEGKNIIHLTLSRNRLSTSSIGKKQYALKLLEKFKNKRVVIFCGLTEVADSLGIPSYHNKSKDDQNFQDFQNKKINHLALANMGKMGTTFIDLDVVILLNATGNKEETAQVLNRAIKLDYKGKVADTHIIALNEPAEKAKIKNTLLMLDQKRIKYAN